MKFGIHVKKLDEVRNSRYDLKDIPQKELGQWTEMVERTAKEICGYCLKVTAKCESENKDTCRKS